MPKPARPHAPGGTGPPRTLLIRVDFALAGGSGFLAIVARAGILPQGLRLLLPASDSAFPAGNVSNRGTVACRASRRKGDPSRSLRFLGGDVEKPGIARGIVQPDRGIFPARFGLSVSGRGILHHPSHAAVGLQGASGGFSRGALRLVSQRVHPDETDPAFRGRSPIGIGGGMHGYGEGDDTPGRRSPVGGGATGIGGKDMGSGVAFGPAGCALLASPGLFRCARAGTRFSTRSRLSGLRL